MRLWSCYEYIAIENSNTMGQLHFAGPDETEMGNDKSQPSAAPTAPRFTKPFKPFSAPAPSSLVRETPENPTPTQRGDLSNSANGGRQENM